VLERPKDPDRLMSLVKKDQNLVARLGILATELDEKILPLMPTLRKMFGTVILGVIEDGPAAAAGLRAGDVIYEIDNKTLRSLKDLMDAARDLKPNQTVVLHIERSGQLQFVEVSTD